MISVDDYNQAIKDYSQNVYRFLYKHLKNGEATNDLVQDTFMKLWENRQNVLVEKTRSWLFTVAYNGMLNYIKKEARITSFDGIENCLHHEYAASYEIKELVEKGLQMLSPLDRSIVLLRDLEGYNYKEIGEILQLNESQVRVYLFRARKKMRDNIKTLTVMSR